MDGEQVAPPGGEQVLPANGEQLVPPDGVAEQVSPEFGPEDILLGMIALFWTVGW